MSLINSFVDMKKHFQFYNPNPSQRYKKDGTPMNWTKGDCAVRCICAALHIEWESAFKIMCERAMKTFTMPNDDSVIEWILENNGFEKHGFSRGSIKPTINEFCELHKTGIYVLRMSGHIVTVVNGMIHDTWDCGEWKVRSYYSI